VSEINFCFIDNTRAMSWTPDPEMWDEEHKKWYDDQETCVDGVLKKLETSSS